LAAPGWVATPKRSPSEGKNDDKSREKRAMQTTCRTLDATKILTRLKLGEARGKNMAKLERPWCLIWRGVIDYAR
jgi:hypothetical protein